MAPIAAAPRAASSLMPKAARRLRALRHQMGSTQRAKAVVSAGDPPEYALVVRGGTVLDGSGSPRFVGDVAVGSNGRIAAVGAGIAGRGAQEIDASGKLVTPGWVDVHTHFDAQVCWDPYFAPAPHNGTTTVIFGNCGVGFAPMRKSSASVEYMCKLMEGVEEIPTSDLLAGLPAWQRQGGIPVFESEGNSFMPDGFQWESFGDFLNHIEALPHAIDFGSNLAYSCVRAYVMGLENASGSPTEAQLAEMKGVVEEAMREGAMGLCASRSANHRSAGTASDGSRSRGSVTGMTGDLAPGFFASDSELLEMASSVAVVHERGVFQCISQMTSGDRPEGFEDPTALIRVEDGTHRGMDWMREVAKMGLTVTPTGEFQNSNEAELESMMATCYRSADEGPGRILPQIGPRSISVNMGIELPLNPFSRHPMFATILREAEAMYIEPEAQWREVKERLREPSVKSALLEESAAGQGHNWYPRLCAETGLKVLRGEACEYECFTSLAATAEAAGMSIWEFAYDELVLRGSIFSLPNTRNQTSLDGVLRDLQRPVTRIGLGDSGAHLTSIMDGGYFPFFLVHYARDRTAGARLSLEECVRILTSDNADLCESSPILIATAPRAC